MNKKIIIVTGASRGIGRAIATELSKNNIVIANYNNSLKEALSLSESNSNINIFKADVSKREEAKALVDYAINKYGKIDVLVNNAGIDQEKLFQDITDEDWDLIIKNNLYSVFCMCQEVVGNMINNKNGTIINISSVYSIYGGPFAVGYTASKAGIDGITKSLAKELAPSNIRVNAIAPGPINTDMNSYLSAEEKDNLINEIPLHRMGEGIDIARCVNWLVNDNYTTGQIISIDGGWMV